MDGRTGHYLFLIGIALAVIAGLIPQLQVEQWVLWVLVILGLIVGFLNVTSKETTEFLVATIALMLVGNAAIVASLGITLGAILGNIVSFVAPAALLVALKAVYALASD